MRRALTAIVVLVFCFQAAPASADLFALDVDAQGNYTQLGNIGRPGDSGSGTLAGMGVGFRGRLQILFLNAIVDYQHLFTGGSGADLLHAGLGVGYRTDWIPVVDLYVQGSIGLLMLAAAADSKFTTEGELGSKLGPELGGQVRAGGGIEIPFAGDFLAVGVGADVGGHYITGQFGYDFSVNLHFGLRI